MFFSSFDDDFFDFMLNSTKYEQNHRYDIKLLKLRICLNLNAYKYALSNEKFNP